MSRHFFSFFSFIMMTALLAAVFTSCEKDTAVPTYTVTFDSKGGSQVASQTVREGGTVEKPADPTRDNHSFGGWSKADSETGVLWDFESEVVTIDMTLFARWAISTYSVTFDSDGGSSVPSQTVAHGSVATKPSDPTRNGYEFDGWFNNDVEWNFGTAITASVTLKAKWTAVYTVTFDSDGGSSVSFQTIRNGATATKPADPTREFRPTSGLYLGTINLDAFPSHYTFIEWRKEGESAAFDFNTPVTFPVTLKAVWDTPSVSLTPITLVLANDIAASVAYVNANSYSGEEYSLLLGADITAGTQSLTSARAKLTIIGIGAERTITASNYRMFTINGDNATNLTLQNITIRRVANVQVDHLINIQRGVLIMRDGSKITGINGSNGYGAVYVGSSNASFKMEGGEISGNNGGTNSSFFYSCVHVESGGTFEMSGGSITGNTYRNRAQDVYIHYDGKFLLSGNARIGTLMLYTNYDANVRSTVIIDGIYSGMVTILHLRGYNSSANVVANMWTNVPVIINGTASVISMFNTALGDFVEQYIATSSVDLQPISTTHVLNASGILVLKEN